MGFVIEGLCWSVGLSDLWNYIPINSFAEGRFMRRYGVGRRGAAGDAAARLLWTAPAEATKGPLLGAGRP